MREDEGSDFVVGGVGGGGREWPITMGYGARVERYHYVHPVYGWEEKITIGGTTDHIGVS